MTALAVPIIAMPAAEARQKLLSYRAALQEQETPAAADRLLAVAFRHLSMGRRLLSLTQAMQAAGTETYTFTAGGWRDGGQHSITEQRPRLAIAQASARECFLHMTQEEDHTLVGFTSDRPYAVGRHSSVHGQTRTVSKDGRTILCRFDTNLLAMAVHRRWPKPPLFKALVPAIPPDARPRWGLRSRSLDDHFVLWQAEWREASPPPPVDPFLLRHIGGDLFVVVKQWDLSPIEVAVLGATALNNR